MAQPFVTGPAGLYLLFPGQSSILFLGHSQRGCRIEDVYEWEPVLNDVSGTRYPFDMAFEGVESFVSCELTRWNMPVLRLLEQVPAVSAALGAPVAVPGTSQFGDLGTLMITEGMAPMLYIQFPYSVIKPAYATQPVGRRYLAAFLERDVSDKLGTQARVQPLTWNCKRVFRPATYANLLYDFDLSGLPQPD